MTSKKIDKDLIELIKKYLSDKEFSSSIDYNIKKLQEQFLEMCNKRGVPILDRMILFESLAQTCFDLFISKLETTNEYKDLLYYCLLKREFVNERVLQRTELGKIIECLLGKEKNMEVGTKYTLSKNLLRRFEVLKKCDFSCAYCGRKSPEVELELEHIIPKSKGGLDNIDNLNVSCRECNRGKRDNLI
jgi:hypothetical protein